jgi:UDP-N-acetylmuramoyl-L-alanyl-D-glutamate--2,6-diaminopimelate ligase
MRFPRIPNFVAGVTGTNGKTSVAYLAYKLLEALGCRCGYIGTLGIFPQVGVVTSLTSPDAALLHETLDIFASIGITHVCVEISSSALDRHRVDQLLLDIAVFTSFSEDHLDIHQTMQRYWQAKLKISSLIKRNGTFLAHASIFEDLKHEIEPHEHYDLQEYNAEKYGHLHSSWQAEKPENFMSSNLEAAGRICEAAGFAQEEIRAAIMREKPQVSGRMQVVSTSPLVIVDFAHTPDGLKKLLQQLPEKKILVFGCGGNRDSSKRKLMGQIAHALATRVVVTDDNPRNEDPAHIRKQIIEGCPNAIEIGDRRTAIEYGIMEAINKSMACVIAGKGHEVFQIYGQEKIPFSDLEIARELSELLLQSRLCA